MVRGEDSRGLSNEPIMRQRSLAPRTMRSRQSLTLRRRLLGYPFTSVDEPIGARMHNEHDVYYKDEMAPLYLDNTFIPGKARGLSGLYNTLLRIFRNYIAPEVGNLDDICGGLVNLMVYARRIKRVVEDDEDLDGLEPIDVMDFIFREIKHCIQGRHVPVYAPYVMMLLIDVAHVSPTEGCVTHIVSYIQKKLPSAQMHADPIPYPSSRRTRSASATEAGSSRTGSARIYFP